MKYKIDHDYHIHSNLSTCSRDPEQTTARILQYAKDNGLAKICLTDHYWDNTVTGASQWYQPQDYEHISKAKPLPKTEGIDFMFGCETELDKNFTLGLPKNRFNDFDFIIVPTTHMHFKGVTISEEDFESNERRAQLWVKKLDALLNMELPFSKIGLAHLACPLINKKSREDYLETLDMISNDDMERLFSKAAVLGCGIELNQTDMSFSDSETDTVLRPFRIAKECRCKFYLGSDAHKTHEFANTITVFERAVNLLELQESDKFHIE